MFSALRAFLLRCFRMNREWSRILWIWLIISLGVPVSFSVGAGGSPARVLPDWGLGGVSLTALVGLLWMRQAWPQVRWGWGWGWIGSVEVSKGSEITGAVRVFFLFA